MKALFFTLMVLSMAAHADDPEVPRTKQIEQLKRIITDPKSTDKELAHVAIMEMALIDEDTKTLAGQQATLEKELVILETEQKLLENEKTPVPSAQPDQPDTGESWHEVTTFSGSSEKNSAPFTITSNRWRVKWTYSISPEARRIASLGKLDLEAIGFFSAEAEPVNGSDAQGVVSGSTKPGSDTTELTGSGSFRLKAISANSDWTMVVEEYR